MSLAQDYRRAKAVRAECETHFSARERTFVAAYVKLLDVKAAKRIARVSDKSLRNPRVVAAVHAALKEREAVSKLTADYVRDYLVSILEFCPTDYFRLGEDGEWCIDPEQFRRLPQLVKRLVERVEVRVVGGKAYISVEFISKTAALAMAVRATLGTKQVVEQAPTLPWDQIGKEIVVTAAQDMEDKIAQLEARACT